MLGEGGELRQNGANRDIPPGVGQFLIGIHKESVPIRGSGVIGGKSLGLVSKVPLYRLASYRRSEFYPNAA